MWRVMNGDHRYNSQIPSKKELQSQIGFYLLPPEDHDDNTLQHKKTTPKRQHRKHHQQPKPTPLVGVT